RVAVQELHALRRDAGARTVANGAHVEDAVGIALQHEFVIALAGKLNVVESEAVTPPAAAQAPATLSDVAATFGATHLLLGDYHGREGVLVVSVRLIDAELHVIVAAVFGTATAAPERGPRLTALAAVPAAVSAPEPVVAKAPAAAAVVPSPAAAF